MSERPDVLAGGAVEILEADAVRPRDDQQMADRHRMQIHESHDVLVLVDDAGLGAGGGDLAERARVLRHGPMLAGRPERGKHCALRPGHVPPIMYVM